MNKYVFILFTLVMSLLVSGCAQKVKMKALNPAQIDRATSTKKIAVVEFYNDNVALSSKIETNLSRFRIEDKPFFTVLSRDSINQVLREQKFQNSGLVETGEIVEVGNLIGAQALISGTVGHTGLSDTRYYEKRSKCVDKKCTELYYYKVPCTRREISLSADIKMVDVTQGDIIHAESILKRSIYTHCRDDSRALPSSESVAQRLASRIADEFTHKLTPYYTYFEVELLDDPDLDYDDTQETLLESSLEYIEHGRYPKAENLLKKLVDSTQQQSYVAFYNLGVVKEAQGDYEKAKAYYKHADNLTIEPVEIIDRTILRINSVIEKRKKTSQQMNR